MDDDLELKVIVDEEFVVNITAELFAYEMIVHGLELGLDSLKAHDIYNSVHTEFIHQGYEDKIYEKAEQILLEKYNIKMKLQ